ncbi:hypothetical protein C791_7689 [Amycolatopsis azurea DSM 43854]|uniref:Uncharacterized protein n=1 Tax=Amycolatopsis azurea DSM 43854 TaxID=1238180 RepID=M2NLU2_9PSEU|nr:hypothetical protein C791_7689 [Amycolatopsis azurea DSM 43854]
MRRSTSDRLRSRAIPATASRILGALASLAALTRRTAVTVPGYRTGQWGQE